MLPYHVTALSGVLSIEDVDCIYLCPYRVKEKHSLYLKSPSVPHQLEGNVMPSLSVGSPTREGEPLVLIKPHSNGEASHLYKDNYKKCQTLCVLPPSPRPDPGIAINHKAGHVSL